MLPTIMQTRLLHAAVLSLAVLLAACGGPITDEPTSTAGTVQTGVPTTSATVTATDGVSAAGTAATSAGATTGTAATPVTVATNSPAPDCAADGCRSPRIIDANAEAWRYDAARRAALADGDASPQT